MRTMDKIRQLGFPDKCLNYIQIVPSKIINAIIIQILMRLLIKEESDVFNFCDILEHLCENDVSKGLIATIREGTYEHIVLLRLCFAKHIHLFMLR